MSEKSRNHQKTAKTKNVEKDIIELLELLGLPYVRSPMEAEAQCAALELAGVVGGVVTEDSDAFLFGAQKVYKNIFDERKYVEVQYTFIISCARTLGENSNDK